MNKDIRVELGFFDHRKTRKLIARFGLDAAWGLLRLWAFAARSRADGVLYGMSNLDIAMEMHVDEKVDPDALINFMQSDECRWLDDGTPPVLHDWHDHNPWAAGAQDRSDASRFSRMAKTHPQIFKDLHARGVKAVSTEEYQSLTKPQRIVSTPLSPAPSPVPLPVPLPAPESKDTPPATPPSLSGEKAGKKKTAKSDYVFEGIPEWISERPWNEYLVMRKSIRAPLTDWGKHLAVLDLEKLKQAGHDPNVELNRSTQKSWKGFFPDIGGIGNGKTISTGNQQGIRAEAGKYDPKPGDKVFVIPD